MNQSFYVRRFADEDALAVQNIIHRGLREINSKDYPAKTIDEYCKYFTVEKILAQSRNAHMYVAESTAGGLLGTGTISSFWGSKTESILLTVYVLPDCINCGIGRAIVRTLEQDAYFVRAGRIEIPSSVSAVPFYRKLGYEYKSGNHLPDAEGLIRLEKFNMGAEKA